MTTLLVDDYGWPTGNRFEPAAARRARSGEAPRVEVATCPVVQMLQDAARRLGNRAAVIHGDQRLGYAELLERVERLVGALAALGIRRGDRVALLLPNGPELVTGFFALAGLGAVAVPLNPRFTESEIGFCLRDARIRAAIADGDCAATCRSVTRGWRHEVVIVTAGGASPDGIGFDSLVDGHPPMRLAAAAPDDDVLFGYSSGATGRPKRVPRTQRQLRCEADSIVATTGLTSDDVVFCTIPLFHAYGIGCCMLAAVRAGATLVVADDPRPFMLKRDQALALLERHAATVLPAVPRILRLLAEAPRGADLSALRLCFSAANPLPRSTFDAFDRRFGIAVRQLYGCTEAGAIAANLDQDPRGTWASVGRPLRGVDVSVVDAAGEPLRAGRIGDVAVRGPGTTRGYAGPTAVHEEAFRDGWFPTGDRGRVDATGRLYITGRRKLLIDAGGDKVDPIEVEDVLAGHPRVREVCVVGAPTDVEGERLVKAVVVADGACREQDLIRFARERLAGYKAPRRVEFRDELPRCAAGRVLREHLV